MLPASPDALHAALMLARARARAPRRQLRVADLRHRNDVNAGMMSNDNGPKVWTQHTANYWPTDGDYS